MEELIKEGFTEISRDQIDKYFDQVYLGKKEHSGQWAYVILKMGRDNNIYDMVGLINGKIFKGRN